MATKKTNTQKIAAWYYQEKILKEWRSVCLRLLVESIPKKYYLAEDRSTITKQTELKYFLWIENTFQIPKKTSREVMKKILEHEIPPVADDHNAHDVQWIIEHQQCFDETSLERKVEILKNIFLEGKMVAFCTLIRNSSS